MARGLMPILCVGEQLAEREAGRTDEVVAAAARCGARAERRGRASQQAVVAYEPVWAIGTGRNAIAGAGAGGACLHPRAGSRHGMLESPSATRILYGGSVKAGNAAELFAMPDVDGGLIGGASLKADEFLAILAAAAAGDKRVPQMLRMSS